MLSNKIKATFAAGCIFIVCGLQATAQIPSADGVNQMTQANHAVIFSYSRIDEDNAASASISSAVFKQHIEAIKDSGYSVRPIREIIDTIKAGKSLPDRTIGISFDRGFQSSNAGAMELLIENDLPFTVFVSAQNTEKKSPQYLSWDDIRSLKNENGVDIGLSSEGAENTKDLTEFKRLINNQRMIYRDNMGEEPALFSYASGEITPQHSQVIKQNGFMASFGLQSGVVHTESNFQALPRFIMAGDFGSLERFKTAAVSLPLPVSDFEPDDNTISAENPVIGFTVMDHASALIPRISCFVSGQGEAKIERLGNRIEVRPQFPLDETKMRINCTAPENPNVSKNDTEQRWHWLGMLLRVTGTQNTEDLSQGLNGAGSKMEPGVLP